MIPIPFNDLHRLEELKSFRILDTAPDPCLDHITRLARRHFGTEIALVSLVDESRQWFKSIQGLDATETPRSLAFCSHAILSEAPLIVFDAASDARFADNPLVIDDPKIRFYAGAPLITPNGFRLGTFCIIDSAARDSFSAEDTEALIEFSAIAVGLMEKIRSSEDHPKATISDQVTENAFTDLFSYVAHEIRSPIAHMGAVSRVFAKQDFGPLGNDHYAEFAHQLDENATHIMGVLERMLNFGHMQSGDVKLLEETIDVADVLEQAVRFGSQAHPGREIDATPFGEALQLRADRTLLTQMLMNLIDNAGKYSPESTPIRLSAALAETGDMAIHVDDGGRGLSTEEVAIALKPYRRIFRHDQAIPKGIGIGLSLVKRLVEMHGGIIELSPSAENGTRATLKFPSYRVGSAD